MWSFFFNLPVDPGKSFQRLILDILLTFIAYKEFGVIGIVVVALGYALIWILKKWKPAELSKGLVVQRIFMDILFAIIIHKTFAGTMDPVMPSLYFFSSCVIHYYFPLQIAKIFLIGGRVVVDIVTALIAIGLLEGPISSAILIVALIYFVGFFINFSSSMKKSLAQ
ncbi:hypothetical protein KKF32_04585 [Patescibacteria group bacterium]|nr:hypothetical protein [Patescibacteria group bacterium]